MKIKYFQKKLVFLKEKYGRISGCGKFSYSKTVSGENFLSVTLESLRTLCTRVSETDNAGIFFTF